MPRVPLVALETFEYAGDTVRRGQVFETVSAYDAQLLVTIKRARLLTHDTIPEVEVLTETPAPSPPPPKKRRPYKRRTPKQPVI